MTFDPTQDGQSSSHYAFEDLSVGRDNDGYVLVHSQNNAGTSRLSYTTFRNVSFSCAHQAGTNPTQAAAVLIQGGFHLTFDNVLVAGGESALRIVNSSHVVMNTVSTPMDWGTAGGVRIQGGGSFIITNLRVEGLDGGTGLSLEDGVGGVTVTNFQSEGKASRALIVVGRAHNVVLIQPHIASAPPASFYTSRNRPIPTYAQTGIWITGQARNVHSIGGGAGHFHQAPVQPSYAVQVDAGARHVHIDHFSIADDPFANIMVAPGAVDAYVNYRYVGYDSSQDFPGSRGNVFFDTYVQASGDLANCRNLSNQYFLCSTHVRLAPGNTLTTLPEGYQGQRLTIVFDGQVTVANSGNIRMAASSGIWNAVANDCLDLIYSRGLWIEASRTARA